ncbi:hypothetical protein AAIR98_001018 [Elusimicrobium simillimum]|uniref:hypothetical protein n=1 Tax=Elusimicrobium simillimum TaxID=3143438 RepID=UPI003C6FB514
MRGVIFFVLVVVLGGVLGIVIEKVAEAILTGQGLLFFVRVYGGIGVHPLSLNITVSGLIGLIAAYFIVTKFVKK